MGKRPDRRGRPVRSCDACGSRRLCNLPRRKLRKFPIVILLPFSGVRRDQSATAMAAMAPRRERSPAPNEYRLRRFTELLIFLFLAPPACYRGTLVGRSRSPHLGPASARSAPPIFRSPTSARRRFPRQARPPTIYRQCSKNGEVYPERANAGLDHGETYRHHIGYSRSIRDRPALTSLSTAVPASWPSSAKTGVLYVNPGSAGPGRFHLPISRALLHLRSGQTFPELIEIRP